MRWGTYSVIRQFADALGCFVTEFLSSVQEVVTRLPNVVPLDPGRRYHRRQNRTGNQPGDADQPGISRQLMANLIARPADEVACSPRPVKNSAASITNRGDRVPRRSGGLMNPTVLVVLAGPAQPFTIGPQN